MQDLVRLVNLALDGSAAADPADDSLYFWVRRNPTWEGDQLAFKSELIAWAEMTDDNAAARTVGDKNAEANTGEVPQYELGSISVKQLTGKLASTHPDLTVDFQELTELDTLPADKFVSPEEAFHRCPLAIAAWVKSEWLAEHHFVNLDSDDWESANDAWHHLGESMGLEDQVTRKEVFHWYLVSETAGELLRTLGEIVVDVDGTSHLLWGRTQTGQVIHMDGKVEQAIILSGFVDKMPPLGAIDSDALERLRLRFTLGGEEYPFQIYGYSEHRPNRELGDVILAQEYRDAGWRVEWGPEFMSEKDGYVRTFRLTNVPEPLGQKCLYLVTLNVKIHTVSGTVEKTLSKLVESMNELGASYEAIRGECHREPGLGMEWDGDKAIDASGELEYSVRCMIPVPPEDEATLRKYLGKRFSGR